MESLRKIVKQTLNKVLVEFAHNPPVTFLFHGTSDVHLDDIMSKGLYDPYLTSDYEKAGFYATEAAMEKGGEPIVLKIRIPSNSKLRVDFNELDEPVSVNKDWDKLRKEIQKAYKIYVQENPGAFDKIHNTINVDPKDYWVSLSTTKTAKYHGVIPAKNIVFNG